MKRIYSIIANGQVSLEGQVIEAGDCIGTLTTEQPIGNVQSLIRFGNVSLQPVANEPAMVKRKNTEAKAKTIQAKEPESESPASNDPDPDTLNSIDTANDSKESEKEPEPELVLDPSFDGLENKWAKALTAHGLTNRESVAKFVSEGGNLKDIDGIGAKTKTAIEAWLK